MSDTRTITDAEWEVHKTTIEMLYQDQDKTLNEVMEMMEQSYNFAGKFVP